MRAVVFDEFGGPNVLRVKEINRPKIKEREMLITVFNAGINCIAHTAIESHPNAGK